VTLPIVKTNYTERSGIHVKENKAQQFRHQEGLQDPGLPDRVTAVLSQATAEENLPMDTRPGILYLYECRQVRRHACRLDGFVQAVPTEKYHDLDREGVKSVSPFFPRIVP